MVAQNNNSATKQQPELFFSPQRNPWNPRNLPYIVHLGLEPIYLIVKGNFLSLKDNPDWISNFKTT
jgi:hypothetical protein